ncbi:MAG: hypothetical protein FJ297_10470 [Planctomycetes bacterium]|nr:hypothetical protein [Planctomycetota bacterium]
MAKQGPRGGPAPRIDFEIDFEIAVPPASGAVERRQTFWNALAERIRESSCLRSRRIDAIDRAIDAGLCVADWPECPVHAERIGRRILLAPASLLRTRCVGLLSSHLGSAPDRTMRWFEGMRAAMEASGPLVVARSATCAPWASHWADRTGRPCFQVDVGRGDPGPRGLRWLVDTVSRWSVDRRVDRAHVSPPIAGSGRGLVSEADACVLAIAGVCFVLKLRPRGRLAPLVREHLASGSPPELRLAIGPELVPPDVANELVAQGAAVWRSFPASPVRRVLRAARVPRVRSVARRSHDRALIHCTRERRGPWPGQSIDDYRDDLIWDRPSADHGALAALLRILASRGITASADGIRGGVPVVCLTDVPLSRLGGLHRYRAHRRRWDFAPFGMGFDRDWLRAIGARPVIYGDDASWNRLDPGERFLFQRAATTRGRCAWSEEREWRVAQSIDLTRVPDDAAFVFTADDESAAFARYVSRWPVVVVGEKWRGA